ncbi:hypothetical protein GCK72_008041 [Caenorhabditis remanei]|uniref:Elongator complex protein 5 n=1 Tax=Caenorhabditis remanei TaxID=31234 RepID=A0A6A5HIT5_CAERE|nr:hypothetical protein GCK72_008041 [Caenorhabditis remanei]KAF1768080.1 hypothetical protein GCK72_008041 [Caenorhabditis remanei]
MSTFYDLPRSSVTVFQAPDVSDAFRILFSSLKPSEKVEKVHFICPKAFLAWHQECHIPDSESLTYSVFSDSCEVNPDDVTAPEVIFADSDIFLAFFGISKTLKLIKSMKTKKRVHIVTSSASPLSAHLEQFINSIFEIKSTEDANVFECSTTSFDKKGNFSVLDQLITIPKSSDIAGAKTTFKTIKKVENTMENMSISTATTPSDTAKSAMDLPFFVGRQEDGVAIRDAATKKIRVGGQIVYEPDRDDDLDDSDPDDDLNI